MTVKKETFLGENIWSRSNRIVCNDSGLARPDLGPSGVSKQTPPPGIGVLESPMLHSSVVTSTCSSTTPIIAIGVRRGVPQRTHQCDRFAAGGWRWRGYAHPHRAACRTELRLSLARLWTSRPERGMRAFCCLASGRARALRLGFSSGKSSNLGAGGWEGCLIRWAFPPFFYFCNLVFFPSYFAFLAPLLACNLILTWTTLDNGRI